MKYTLLFLFTVLMLINAGCSDDLSSNGTGNGSDTDSGQNGDTNINTDIDIDTNNDTNDDNGSDNNNDTDTGCAKIEAKTELKPRPVDIIISIDNSSSMNEEIKAVQERINVDLADTLTKSGIDYRVILVTRYGHPDARIDGSDNPVCIGPPLGNAACSSTSDIPNLIFPAASNPSPDLVRFMHHSSDIASQDMWCKLLTSLKNPDEEKCLDPDITTNEPNPKYCVINNDFGGDTTIRQINGSDWDILFTNGWMDKLRSNAYKVFVAITDDSPEGNGCDDYKANGKTVELTNDETGANNFDLMLRTMAPEQFGQYDTDNPDANRNYTWHSIIGFSQAQNSSDPSEPTAEAVTADQPVMDDATCRTSIDGNDNTGADTGIGYQYLSKLSGGLRYPSCLTNNFDAIFDAIAQNVISEAAMPCEFEIPSVDGKIDFTQVNLTYVNGDTGKSTTFSQADNNSAAQCDGYQFYFNSTKEPTLINLCPDACAQIQADKQAQIDINFACVYTPDIQ